MGRHCKFGAFIALACSDIFTYGFVNTGARIPRHQCRSQSRRETRIGAGPPETSSDPWVQALLDASGKPSGGLIGLEGLRKDISAGKLKGLRGPAEGSEKRLQENSVLLNWLADSGVWVFDRSDWGKAPHSMSVAIDTVDEAENEKAGRGMIANKDIKEGDELFKLPLDLILTKARAVEEFSDSVITEDTSEYIAIALLLIKEKSKGEESFWKPYIDLLPTIEEVGPTFVWSEEDLSLLEGSPVISSTASMKLKLEKEYATLKEGLFAQKPSQFPAEVFTFSEFQWAFTMLFSRAIRLTSLSSGEAIALIPYADLFNHNPFANSYIDAVEEGFFNKREEIIVYSDRSYKRMEQVFISYGPKSNADLLLLYGFCLDRNPFNSVEVTVTLDTTDPLYPQKKAFLAGAGRPEAMAFPLYNDRYPDEVLQYLRLACLEPRDAKKTLDDIEFSEVISNTNELQVLQSIQDACTAALTKYPTTEEQDTAMMSDRALLNTLTKNQRMAVKHRRQEKRILKRTIAAVSKEKDRIAMPLGV